MRKIKLVPGEAFYNRCEIDVYDVTDEKEKKRCKIKMEYATVDIRQLKEKDMGLNAVIKHYKDWIYDVVKHYITDDWQCVQGMEETLTILREHIEENFKDGE